MSLQHISSDTSVLFLTCSNVSPLFGFELELESDAVAAGAGAGAKVGVSKEPGLQSARQKKGQETFINREARFH